LNVLANSTGQEAIATDDLALALLNSCRARRRDATDCLMHTEAATG
jgi:hypothetical protein